jgi:hypothetical protein
MRRLLPRELTLSRRTLLRGVAAGSAVGLGMPLLDAMLDENGTRLADGAPIPRRFMTWVFGNGCVVDDWVPTTQGEKYTLSRALEPLAKVKNYCAILTGLRNYVAGRRGHHDGMAGVFSGHPFVQLPSNGAPYASKFGGPSIDQVIADAIGQDSYHKSLQIGVSRLHMKEQGPTLETMSHRGPDQPLLAERDPLVLYDRLFDSFMPADDPAQGVRSRALDAVLADAKRLKERVGKADQLRLDAHLESVFQLQKQILAIPPSCALPQKPDALIDPPDEPLVEINAVMCQLVAMAFSCDLTRVISYMFSGPSGGAHFHMLPPGVIEGPGGKDYSHDNHHNVSHISLPYEQSFIGASVVVSMTCFATLLEQLMNTPEGDGNLLDHSCILMSSGVAEGWSHSEIDYPLIVAGHAGGGLKTGVGHDRSPDEQSVSDVGLACIQAVAPEAGIDAYGSDSGIFTGGTTTPSSAILA